MLPAGQPVAERRLHVPLSFRHCDNARIEAAAFRVESAKESLQCCVDRSDLRSLRLRNRFRVRLKVKRDKQQSALRGIRSCVVAS